MSFFLNTQNGRLSYVLRAPKSHTNVEGTVDPSNNAATATTITTVNIEVDGWHVHLFMIAVSSASHYPVISKLLDRQTKTPFSLSIAIISTVGDTAC
jgi:hypothetical protein